MHSLSEKERLIFDCIILSAKQEKRITVKEVANECHVSASLVMKLAKKLGYSGFSEMYYASSQLGKMQTQHTFQIGEGEAKVKTFASMLLDLLQQNKGHQMLVTSLGSCDCAAMYLTQKLQEQGHLVLDNAMNPVMSQPQGLMFVLSESGNNLFLIKQIQLAKQQGYTIINITSNKDGATARLSDIVLEVAREKSSLNEYRPNLFTARVMMLFEYIVANY
ncbi:MAG: MurR/RpiR family transcriptional regulator [Erysipelotrichaceae bacterium]